MRILPDRAARERFAAGRPRTALDELVTTLLALDWRDRDEAAILRCLQHAPLAVADIVPRLTLRADRHTRNCIYRDERFELLVVYWPRGVRSPVHGHGNSRGFVKVMAGSLETQDFALLDGGRQAGPARVVATGVRRVAAGEFDAIVDGVDVHRVRADGGPALSLHLYTGPIENYLVYDLDDRLCRTATAHYDRYL